MSERWVVNASPVIVLSRVELQGVFFDLTDEVLLPQAVALEIEAGPADDPARRFLAKGQMTVIPTMPAPTEILAWDLGAGETAVLSYALENPGWTAILDDGAVRKCARSFAIVHKGTLAIVILAKQRGLVASASDTIRKLQQGGYRINEHIIREALRKTVGEEW